MMDEIHHLGLTVRDVEVSAAWYVAILGFHQVGEYTAPDDARRKVFLRHDGLRARLGLTQHRHRAVDAFDETRTGLDHLAFAVTTREELDTWAHRFADAGVAFSPVAPANSITGAAVLVLRDPDNIQLELFFDPNAEQLLEFFVDLESQVWDALAAGDAAADEALLTADFVGVYPTGFAGRSDHVGDLTGGPTVASYSINDARLVRVSGSAVLLCYRADYHRASADGSRAEETMYISSLWIERDGNWRNVFSQDTPASTPDA
jgi:catechol 2,3-dioxygenase-like lactoylglutathione lyase family enzyme